MSIATEILRIQKNIADAFDAVEEKGGTVEPTYNSDNLKQAILSIEGMTLEDGDNIKY